MRLYRTFERDTSRPLAVAIGFFDGMHAGHWEIARRTRALRRPGWRSGVLTFSNHPVAFLRPGEEPPLLMTPEERIVAFARAGYEECFFVPFDASVATLTAERFMEEVLLRRLRAGAVVTGATFRFGHRRGGDVAMLSRFCAEHGVAFRAVDAVCDASGERISSTRIRALIAAGKMQEADALTAFPYEVRGIVERGSGRGHALGFPTANLRVPPKLLPPDGVYAAVARYDGRDYAALVSVGDNPQFGGTERTVEVWLRDFHYTIYGHQLAVREWRFVREQRRFDDVEGLVAQMRSDLAAVAFPAYG
jgi:riboflavin kinase/FMN adenylyltransferase